ncbi:hypothetical protein [Rhodopseudomonas palustris]|uniref:hypothetical protein n=1 Tax=Rhodopseudomonas palustris TaxID=1076 RepID=UPI0021F2DFDD|nr:hypothetical protein [Rhodopseudomonas palustris]UYO54598.1 hypothetical protein KQX61_04020 [Rhodopseudomonas palustris]
MASTGRNRQAVADAINLLIRHGRRGEIRFKIVGTVPQSCLSNQCEQIDLVRRRVQILLRALRRRGPVELAPLNRLDWSAVGEESHSGIPPDRLIILLESVTTGQKSMACPARFEVLDPELPGSLERPDHPAWIPIDRGMTIPVSQSARLRLINNGKPDNPVRVFWVSGGHKRPLSIVSADPEGGAIYALDFEGASAVVEVSAEAEHIDQRSHRSAVMRNDDRAMGDLLNSWPPERFDQANSPDANGSNGCYVRIEHSP